MKILSLFLVLLLQTGYLFAQRSPYYDALFLKTVADSNGGKFRLLGTTEVLKNYFNNNKDLVIDSLIQENPFLNKYYASPGKQSIPNGLNIPGLVGQIGGLDVTAIADGAAKFLVKRTKQELSIAFFDRFKKAITDERYKELQTLFPLTYQTLVALGDEIYQYEAYVQTLRESFESDLRNLPENIPGILGNYDDIFKDYPELKAILQTSFYVAGKLRDKEHPGDILADYPVSDYLDSIKDKNWKGSIQTLQLISSSLRDTSANRYWVSQSQIKELVQNETAFQMYLGLIYQQVLTKHNDSIAFNNNFTLIRILDTVAHYKKNYQNVKKYISGFAERTEKINSTLKSFQKQANDSLSIEQYYVFFNTTLDFLEYSSRTGTLQPLRDSLDRAFHNDVSGSLKKYIGFARTASNIVLDVNRRNYSGAIIKAAYLYDSTIIAYAKQRKIVLSKDVLISYADKKDLLERLDNMMVVSKKLIKYGSFMAAFAQAKNSDEVADAIEAFALPAGSSRIKRESCFNVSLNAYVGGFYGKEVIENINNNDKWNSMGITSPIGIAFSEGHSVLFIPWEKSFVSSTIFVSLIDLGAMTAYRFDKDNKDSTENIPNTVKLRDIFSPGIFYSMGINGSPISINFGYQLGPLLRKVQLTDRNLPSPSSYSRLSFSLCVDIPLLDFYTKPRD